MCSVMDDPSMIDTATHGSLGLSSPWARQYLPADLRHDVEQRIPAGHVLGVGVGRRAKPGDWVLWLNDPSGKTLWKTRALMRDLQGACLWALARHGL
jgi:hypothetical protein